MESPLSNFVQRNCFREIERILTTVNEETERPFLPVPIILLSLFDHDPELALNLLVKPKEPWNITKELSEAFDRTQLANISLFPDAKLKSNLEFNLKSL